MEDKLKETGLTEEELFKRIDIDTLSSEKITAPRYSYWQSVFRVFFKNKVNIFALSLLGIVLLLSYVYPIFFKFDEFGNIMDASMKHMGPLQALAKTGDWRYWLGTGAVGESTWDAVWNGSKISITLALVCGAINMTIGVILGAVWGFSKKFDMVMTEVYNVLANIPYTLMISVLVMLFSASFWTMVFALTVTGWLGIAYFIRTQVIIIRDREYNLASKCLGTSTIKIAMKNILPFMTSVIVTLLASEIPGYISYEVFLSYIGMGLSEQSLGKLIYQAEASMVTAGWEFEFWVPVAVSSIITVVLYVVGQSLGDASDPRTHM